MLILLSWSAQEFIRIGYYVNNEYWEEELKENPPDKPLIDRSARLEAMTQVAWHVPETLCVAASNKCMQAPADITQTNMLVALLQIVQEHSGRQAKSDQIPS